MRHHHFGQTIQNHWRENLSLYVFTLVLFTMGVSFGAVIVNSLAMSQKQDLIGYLGQFFVELNQGLANNPKEAFQQTFAHYLKYIGFIWILGLSIIGLPIILVMIFLKGLVLGFTVGFLVNQWHWKGLYLAVLSVLPQNILVIPAIIIVGTAGIAFSLRLIRSRFNRRGDSIYPHFLRYSLLVFLMGIVFCFVSFFEAFASPALMKLVSLS
jgi:stage II sporulation protein M